MRCGSSRRRRTRSSRGAKRLPCRNPRTRPLPTLSSRGALAPSIVLVMGCLIWVLVVRQLDKEDKGQAVDACSDNGLAMGEKRMIYTSRSRRMETRGVLRRATSTDASQDEDETATRRINPSAAFQGYPQARTGSDCVNSRSSLTTLSRIESMLWKSATKSPLLII
jgi:hypothetical protein